MDQGRAVGEPAVAATGAEAVAADAGAQVAVGEVWEPGMPSMRAMAPGALVGGLAPFLVYELIHPHLASQVEALLLAGCVPALWVAVTAAVTRRLEPIGLLVLVGLGLGALMAASGGGPYAVKARDAAFAGAFGLACLASLAAPRPIMFLIGRALGAGGDRQKLDAYDALWELPTGARTFRIITAAWGAGLVLDAVVQLVLDAVLPTPAFLVAGPVIGGVAMGGLFVATVWYTKRARRLGEAEAAASGLVYPSVVLAPRATDPERGPRLGL